MRVGDAVRIYYGCEWFESDVEFDEGKIESIEEGIVTVDFLDWKSVWSMAALRMAFPVSGDVLIALEPGLIVRDYR